MKRSVGFTHSFSPMPFLLLLMVVGSLLATAAFSQTQIEQNAANKIDWLAMFMWLAGGLALFLFGMEQMVKGLLVVAGDKLKVGLAKLTNNRVMGALTGAGITAVIQSSSVTTVLVVGFVSAGLITLTQAAGVIMGANLGTTITAQIVAFKVTNFALLMIAIGFSMQFLAKLRRKKALGDLIMGLGLIFFGVSLMSEGMAPLRDYPPFLDLMQQMQNPFYGILLGLVFTALVQSSSATIAVVIVMASNGFLTLPAGIALVLGADIGTTITALLAAIGKSREALRAALIHVQFNIYGVLIWLPFIPELANMAVAISAHATVSDGSVAMLAENTPREIANANTLFKVVCLAVFLPFIPVFLWVVYKILPVLSEEKTTGEFQAEFLDKSLTHTPSLAMKAVNLELEHYQKQVGLFYKRVVSMIANPNFDRLSREDLTLQRLRSYQRQILSYLGQTGQNQLTPEEQTEYMKLMNVVNNLESMLEAAGSNLLQILHEMTQDNIKPSETMLNLVGQLTSEVGKAMDNALKSIYSKDSESAMAVLAIKQTIDHLIQDALTHQVKRFRPDEERLKVFRYEMQLIDGLKQLHTLSKRIARLQLAESNQTLNVSSGLDKVANTVEKSL
ncbi:Na/Pi cotransporter family protein [Thiomicrorhabdus aquaedulcis]|uniref:Na/Pi cotransporter family protein n=1 Tax=Thiomicrorhabdus aquaedulcis TaxID=2211106 RepID=UPI001E3940FD|nr:Na/Pi cotransporter family protein [Thiomicrorhabdus aquaedulcis]